MSLFDCVGCSGSDPPTMWLWILDMRHLGHIEFHQGLLQGELANDFGSCSHVQVENSWGRICWCGCRMELANHPIFLHLLVGWNGHRRCRCYCWPGHRPDRRVKPSCLLSTIFAFRQTSSFFRLSLRRFTSQSLSHTTPKLSARNRVCASTVPNRRRTKLPP